MVVGIVDYEAGNIRSVERALAYLGVPCVRSADPETLFKTDKLIFPGVGEAFSALRVLSRTGLGECVRDFAKSGKYLLGICLGSQIILEFSEERNTPCLGIVRGKALRFTKSPGLKIPHMGWNQVRQESRHPLFGGIPDETSFYFVHSYYPAPSGEAVVLGTTSYGIDFTAVYAKDNICACQFHPEKSGENGLKLLGNFIEL